MSNTTTTTATTDYEAGLRSFFTSTYNRIAASLLLTAVLAYLSTVPPLRDLFITTNSKGQAVSTLLGMLIGFGPLLMILFMGRRAYTSVRSSAILLWASAAMFGLSLGTIVLTYTSASLATTFLATAAGFGSLSLWGYVTKRNLSGWGSFLIVGLIGLIVAMVINLFVASSVLNLLIAAAGILIFAGLTAFDTQRMKIAYQESHWSAEELEIAKNSSAFSLYLNFLNMFLFVLQFLGVKLPGQD